MLYEVDVEIFAYKSPPATVEILLTGPDAGHIRKIFLNGKIQIFLTPAFLHQELTFLARQHSTRRISSEWCSPIPQKMMSSLPLPCMMDRNPSSEVNLRCPWLLGISWCSDSVPCSPSSLPFSSSLTKGSERNTSLRLSSSSKLSYVSCSTLHQLKSDDFATWTTLMF